MWETYKTRHLLVKFAEIIALSTSVDVDLMHYHTNMTCFGQKEGFPRPAGKYSYGLTDTYLVEHGCI